MWDELEVTYEETEKVKQTLVSLLVYDYELFKMKNGESIEETFAIFSTKLLGNSKLQKKSIMWQIKLQGFSSNYKDSQEFTSSVAF